MAAPKAPGAVPSGVRLLEERLQEAFWAIVRTYGPATAIQSVGKLLAAPLPLATEAFHGADGNSGSSNVQPPPSEPPSELPSPRTSGELVLSEALDDRAPGSPKHAPASTKWRRAVAAAQSSVDPWAGRQLHVLPMEHCVRLRYDPKTTEWVTDDVLVKVENKPFAAGAMRECYAMKKLSTFTNNVIHDWKKAANCVAKRYKKESKKKIYFTDVLVQMDAKSLGEEYNKTGPPKKVDVLQCAVLQFCDRPGMPLYSVEQLIEGDYVKYNSNSGFVKGDNDVIRNTPQAFSHYTFELTHGYKICVDIQGVGDLYTDPQVHTIDGQAYGEGNLGLRGMALFFRTHECNELCSRLKLQRFDRCEADVKAQGYASDSSLSSNISGTISRTLNRRSSYKKKHNVSKHKTAVASSKGELLEGLRNVPLEEPPIALVHIEVSKLYAEVVLLPELRPQESPEDALRGGLFHLNAAASQGCRLAMCLLARIHWGMEPTITQFAHLAKSAKQSGALEAHPDLAFRYAALAAERGVRAACASMAHAYATGLGLGEHVLEEAQPVKAISMYKRLLGMEDPRTSMDEERPYPDDSSDPEGGGGGGGAEPHEPQSGPSVLALARSLSWAFRGARSESQRRQGSLRSQASSGSLAQAQASPLSKEWVEAISMAAEQEALGLPGAAVERYEVLAQLGALVMEGYEGVPPDFTAAAAYFTEAAEEAEAALKPKLCMKYFDLAAQAEGNIP